MDFLKTTLLEHIDEEVDMDKLRKAVEKCLKQEISESAVIDSLRKLRAEGIRGHRLTIGRGYARIERSGTTVVEERFNHRTQTKQKLGMLLWEALFEVDLGGASQGVKKVEASILSNSPYRQKLEALRRKLNVNILIDAGSSTSVAAEALLRVDSVPIRVRPKGTEGARLFRPRFTTNSLAIARIVTESRHYDAIEVRLIGGDVRVDRGSICGPLTEVCLEAWNARCDLAVIGTTGYRENATGTPSFGCDDLSEARLKGAMLGLAWFRVLIFDSSKLSIPEVSSVFAPLSRELIDLVVLDDGREIGAEAEVKEFVRETHGAGIHTLVLQTEPKHA